MNILILGGGGTLGSTTAAYIACKELADTVYLLDINRDAAEYHAVDMAQAALSGSHTQVKVGTWEDLADCQLLIIAAGLPAAVATHDPCKDMASLIPTIREIAEAMRRYNPAVTVLSMTNPLDIFSYVLYDTAKLPAKQFLALSRNDTIRFQQGVAAYFKCAPNRVDCVVVGEHGPHKVHLFSSVKVDGVPQPLAQEAQQWIRNYVNDWWDHFLAVSNGRAAAWTTSVSAGQVIEHMLGLQKGPICCSVIGEEGQGYSMGWPVELDMTGVAALDELSLPENELAQVDAARVELKGVTHAVLDYLAGR